VLDDLDDWFELVPLELIHDLFDFRLSERRYELVPVV
jgi:hypothetical protein